MIFLGLVVDINRILIVGLGSIGRRHLRLAREQFPNATIKVLRHSISHELCEEADGSFSTLVEAIAFQPQLAVIAGPATFHLDTALPLAEAGVNLLVEKPISASISGVAQLIKAVEKQGSTLLTGYNLRFLPSLQFFRAKLDDGLIGKFLSVRCEMGQYLPSWRPDSNYRTGVSARAELGGGVLLELSHELDFLRWIFGEIEWIKATLSRQSALDIDVEDAAHLTLGFAPDAGGCQLIGSVNLDFFRHDTTRLCTVIGEKGSLQWNGITGEVMFYKSGANGWTDLAKFSSQRDDSYLAEWKNFLNSVSGHEAPFITGSDGLKVLQIVEAARRSSKSGAKEFITESLD